MSRGEAAFLGVVAVVAAILILFLGHAIGTDNVVNECRKYGAYKAEQVEMTCEVKP